MISVFGNPDLPFDALPLQLLPRLAARFPGETFRTEDPNELDLPTAEERDWTIIDTVAGIGSVQEIPLEKLVSALRLTAHDFDLGAHLLLTRKLFPTLRVRILGVPMSGNPEDILEQLTELLQSAIPE